MAEAYIDMGKSEFHCFATGQRNLEDGAAPVAQRLEKVHPVRHHLFGGEEQIELEMAGANCMEACRQGQKLKRAEKPSD